MRLLVLNRQKPELSPFRDWLGADAIADARLFTSSDRVTGFDGFGELRAFDAYEESALIELEALRLAKAWPFDRIVATSEADILRAGRLRSHLGLDGQSAESALAYRDKVVMKDHLAGRTTLSEVPSYARIELPFDLLEFVERHGLPVVVKPVDGSGSHGTTVLRDDAELVAYLASPMARGLEVESYVDGEMFHVDGFQVDGEVVFSWPSRYVGNGLSHLDGGFVAGLMVAEGDPLVARLQAAVQEVVGLLPRYPAGSFHLELFRTADDRLVFCEIASRTGGGLINPMLREAFGIDLNQLFITAMAGQPVDVAEIRERGARPLRRMAHGIIPARDGRIAGLPTEPVPHPWVTRFDWMTSVGAEWRGPFQSSDSLARFLADLTGQDDPDARLAETLLWGRDQVAWATT